YRRASPEDQREAHRAWTEATDGGADPDHRAWHLALATAGGDEKVAGELELSAGGGGGGGGAGGGGRGRGAGGGRAPAPRRGAGGGQGQARGGSAGPGSPIAGPRAIPGGSHSRPVGGRARLVLPFAAGAAGIHRGSRAKWPAGGRHRRAGAPLRASTRQRDRV